MLQSRKSQVTALLGPTNTGKTHEAIQRMLSRESGIIGLPLRLLAREVYDKIASLRSPQAVALITGEERILPPRPQFFVCTVEAMPLERGFDFVAIDEIQMCADPERGHIFTDRLLHARGRHETLFLGADTVRGLITELIPETRIERRERFSELSYAGARKISRLRPRTAVVAFSVDQVYAIAELIRRQRGGAAVVMGALSPRTRNAQVALYQNGEVDYLVATDAIGMGLNMDVDHVAFAGRSKFDGRRIRNLHPNELAQIAGRAGRYTSDGSFGVTADCDPLEPEVADAIEQHRFAPVRRLEWRNSRLSFASIPALIASLEESPTESGLNRAREAEDLTALKTLAEVREVQNLTRHPDQVRQLWACCQIPDFRKTAPQDHANLISRIYQFLRAEAGCIPSDWFSEQLNRVDRTDGDIDTLSTRLAFIRTWTYVANRPNWVEHAAEWRERTRKTEDRLGDALHAALTQRFVDRRSSDLMRRLKGKERLLAEVNDKGEVSAEGHFLGRLDGFRFTVDETASSEELKTLRSASMAALASEFAKRADKLYLSPDTEIDLTEQGGLMWGTDAIGKLEKGDTILAPKIRVFVDDIAGSDVAEKVERRLTHWISRRIQSLFEALIAMRDDEAVSGLAKGVGYQLVEALGIIPRREIADDIRQLAQEDRGLLRKHGVRFGQHNIFMTPLLKPAPTRMRLVLWSLWQGLDEFPEAPPAGHVTVPALPNAPDGFYEMAGYRLCGQRALRIDMLERLADLLRPMDARAGFEAQPDMLSITGCTLEQFADIMQSLNFRAEKGERPKPAPTPRPASEAAEPAAAAQAPPEGAETAGAGETEETPEVPVATVAEPEASPAPEEPTEEQTGPDTSTEPEIEVFYTFTIQRRSDRGGERRGNFGRGQEQDGQKRRGKGPRKAGGKPGGKPGHKGKPKSGGPKSGEQRQGGSKKPAREEKQIDPDSPFAVLQQLKKS
ncbi:MAG: helicase-related protein [Pseudomonadota bacterium]